MTSILSGSLIKKYAIDIASSGTEKIKTLDLTGPSIGVEYIQIEVPKDIAPIDTKKKFIKNLKSKLDSSKLLLKLINGKDIKVVVKNALTKLQMMH